MASVRFDKVHKRYDNGHVAVHAADFEVADGELLVLVGPSGCGKSTLLRMIAGLESITSGTLSIDGRVVNDVAPKHRDIAMVFQNYALYPHMTVAENLAFGLKLRNMPKAQIQARIAQASQMLGLDAMLQRQPKELSGGQRQRVALGRALVREPKVFLLDEPLSNLDAKLRLTMRTEIARLHRTLGTTMIYVTHDQIEAMTLGQRIVVLRDGQIQQIDTPMALYERPANVFVAGFLGSPAMNFLRGRVGADGVFDSDAGTIALGDVARLPAGVAPGRELVLGLRPEHLQLESGADTRARIDAVLETVEPLGNEMFLNLRLGGNELVARVPPATLPEPGAALRLFFDPARLHAFDAATETRIA
ncbi:ABC transporter ATP-binding protein [Chiayiivirga flava]|uniref:Multiple sugar transport system ATP-binding protein n=1 Tax=Chiayiivirga flava TaxID=659595 RepID=A0A7W8G396_9GAMM|nr:sn-glycerol-3-phosphate ABC transporter ATP-binding protein UgpC [Chiayiivirga flava]MBB5209555.1 multiple sugar transport system ATP-binding protein [Chiayiivirga flava]